MEILKLLIDFGMMVLIWTVQLVVYPGFLYYDSSGLLVWHKKYTTAITTIVAPLMLAQIILHGTACILYPGFLSYLGILLVISSWILTFGWAVPLHNKINVGISLKETSNQLVVMNWYRTATWTGIFIISLIQVL